MSELASAHRPPARRRRSPDPQLGVFETLLVVAGRPLELGPHMDRLAASLTELFPDRTPPVLGEEAEARAREIELGSVRIAVAPANGIGFDLEVSAMALAPELTFRSDFLPLSGKKSPARSIALRSLTLPGGLGPHKWADRSLLDLAQAGMPAGALPLIVDRDGSVLEASRANIFAVRTGALFTPPLDGRILPGITRARVLESAAAIGIEAHEEGLSYDDLLAAEEVFLTGSVRGIERARSVDGTELAVTADVAARIATRLRGTWTAARFG